MKPADVSKPARLILATSCLALLPGLQASAQDSAGVLEELVVTARKQEQNLQDVSLAVALLSGKALAEAHLQNAGELSTLIPTLNLQDSSDPSTSSFNIRGIGTRTFSSGVEPSVSTMLDGVVMARSGMSFIDLIDVQRVEVLRGPQGTLYGKNASGGVVHIITRDPTEEWSGSVAATAIEQDEYRLDGTVSGPLSDTIGLRLTGSAVDDDGWASNAFTGENVNNRESWSLRGKLAWDISDSWDLLWSSDVSDSDCNCTALSLRSIMESPAQDALIAEQLPVVASEDNQDVNNDEQTISKTKAQGHSLTLNWAPRENYVITSITAWREWQSDSIVDLDRRPSNPLALSFPEIPNTDLEQLSQELRIASSGLDWGSFVLGAFYFDQTIDTGNMTTTALLEPFLPATTRTTATSVDSENYALFGEVTFSLNEQWALTLGGRYTRDKLSYETDQQGTDNLVFPPEVTTAYDVDEDDFSPKVALQWDINDKHMTYASYTKGYKGPAFDLASAVGQEAVDPETSDAFELGWKSTWADGRLALNVAAFHATYKDFQVESYVDDDLGGLLPAGIRLVNAAEVSTQGIEIDIISQPLDGWTLTAGFAWTDASIDDFPSAPCGAGQQFRGECPDGFQDLSGATLPTTPEYRLTLATSYLWELENLPFNMIFAGNLRAQDDVQYGIAQDPFTVQDAYTIVDISAAVAGKQTRYKVTGFIKNVFDEDFASIIFGNPAALTPHAYVQLVPKYARRTAGVELRYDF